MTAPTTRRWGTAWSVLAEAGLLGAAALDSLLETTSSDGVWPWLTAGLALAGLLVRRHRPGLGFLATLPGLITSSGLIATLIALYSLSRQSDSKRVVGAAATVTVIGFAVKFPVPGEPFFDRETLIELVYGILQGAAPAALGQLVRARETLRRQLRELDDSHRAEQELREAQVLERERNRLAREMHDVVSHQVSLIAVQAGALQIGGPDDTTRQAARTIRELGVSTLDELRHMVAVLRTPNSDRQPLQPQPGLAQLRALVESSGIGVTLEQDPDLDHALDRHAQRAVYRTVQEGLTNARKHAPGAPVRVRVVRDGPDIEVTVHNGRATGRPLGLPSSQQGLVGLRERADLVGGTLTSGPADEGGFRLVLRLPATARRS
ncbi:sensor histidine kinase [Pseudonocardia sp. TRM90224]|uniref:sensor histidine kinase n=1 Tax=Pseudonocardia sp. TRM90224 TaxID=2812678 RepID=UPI001E414422|nr:histidine kinase [Pseudonocardia sp. TRM90224]